MANYTPGEAIMFCAIFVCLFALALLALARPLRMLCKCGISTVLGVFALSGQKPWRGGGYQCRNACGFRISGAARRGRYFSAEFFLVEAEGHCGEIC